MLHDMGYACFPGGFDCGAGFDPKLQGHEGRRVISLQDHPEAVREEEGIRFVIGAKAGRGEREKKK